jgi:hypothetical protein
MKSGAPWKLKGRGPEGREIARAAARRSGTSVGEWLNRVIAAADDEDEEQPPPRDVDHEPRRRRWRQGFRYQGRYNGRGSDANRSGGDRDAEEEAPAGAKAGLIARSRRASLPISAVATAAAVRNALPVARRGATRTCRPIRTCRSIRRWPKSWRGSARWTARLPANASPPSGSTAGALHASRRRPRLAARELADCA